MDAMETVKKFMKAWRNRDWSEMFRYTQKTWQSKGGNNPPSLMDWFGPKKLTKTKIIDVYEISDCCVDITLKISYLFISNLKEAKIRARVICETEPYKPNKDGTWGINPLSILREF
ncbi:hypothetical protein ES695_08255 [Candidatus Atribacteria bacterium 1244-E10-H5-B2]|nr:MAG: hypothetical protein ES695_08255 [Candidatus Atribacteria bacterium 1244-E10-H5-B2]